MFYIKYILSFGSSSLTQSKHINDQVGDQPLVSTVNKSIDSLPTDQTDSESEAAERSHR